MLKKIASGVAADARILVARLDAIDDCILSAGFFIGLRALFPTAHITGVFQEETAPLYESSGRFDTILRCPQPDPPSGAAKSPGATTRALRRWLP